MVHEYQIIKKQGNIHLLIDYFYSFYENTSVHSLQEVPFPVDNSSATRLSITSASQQWPPSFVLNQAPSFPLPLTIQSATTKSQPKRHPLRRESMLHGVNNERESSLWPFRTITAVLLRQTNEIKENDLFLSS